MRKQIQRRLVAGEIDELVEAYRSGAKVQELAARFSVHSSTVSRTLEREGVRSRNRRLGRDEIQLAVELYKLGGSLANVSEELNVSHTTIWKALRREGVALRDRHGRER
jgi:DNA invertase Pin-like site-specific DNA recombinase